MNKTAVPHDMALNAKAWVDAAESRWRLQILARRTRTTSAGVKTIPSRIRRFVEGLPWAYVKPAIDYLLSKAPYTGVIVNGVDFGVPYRPTLTVWQRDAGSVALGAGGAPAGDATYTLVQDLIEADAEDVYAVGTSSSCSESVESTYVWDSPEVGELPAGGMGVTYQIVNVHRNDDGTFDYALVKRVALTQHSGPVVVVDNALQRVEQETWDNVYVGPGGEYCDHGWTPLGVPSAGLAEAAIDGTGVIRETKVTSVAENADCTLKLVVQTEVSRPALVRVATSENQFQATREREDLAQPSALGDAPQAAGGVVVRHESKLRADGTYDNTVRTETEQGVATSVKEVSVGRRGRRTVVKSDNQAAPASFANIGWGGSVRVEKTPGRLYTNTVTKFDRNTSDLVGSTCKSNQFQHVHSETRGAASAAVSDLSWGAGYVRTAEASMDDDGAIVRTDHTEFERNVNDAEVTCRYGVSGAYVTRKDVATRRDLPSRFTPAVDKVGMQERYEKTPGGLVTVTTSEVRRPTRDLPVSVSCESTALAHTVRTRVAVPAIPTMSDKSVHTVAGAGRHSVTEYRLDDEGGCLKETSVVQEADVESEKSYERKPRGTIVTVVQNSTSTSATAPRSVGLSHSVLTPGNRYRLTTRTAQVDDKVLDRAYCSKDAFLHQHDRMSYGTQVVDKDVAEAGGGVYRYRESTLDSDGFVQTVEREHVERPVNLSGEQLGGDYFHTVWVTKSRSVGQIGGDGSTPIATPGPITTHEKDLTQGAMWSGQKVVDTPIYRSWTDEINTSLYKSKTVYFRNANEGQKNGCKSQVAQYVNQLKGSGWNSGTAPTSVRVLGSPVMNQYGLFDGHYAVEASWDPITGGAENDRATNMVSLAHWSYTVVSNSYNIGYTRDARNEVITSVHRTRTSKTVSETITSGYRQYLATHFHGTLIEGSHVTVTPTTGIAHGVVVTEANTTISIEDIRGSQQNLNRNWTDGIRGVVM